MKLRAALPPDHGLTVIEAALIDDPHQVRVCVVLLDCKSVKTDADSGEEEPTARIRQIEVVRDDDDRATVRAILERMRERRTGVRRLPFHIEEELASAFGEDVTVEVHRAPRPAEDGDR